MKTFPTAIFAIILLAFSCNDHVAPGSCLSIKTLPFEHVDTSTIFKIQVENQCEKPVKEYGIVYTAYFRGVGNHNIDPTITDNKIAFDTAIMPGGNQFTYAKDFFNGRIFFYYRAYAILGDGSVIYGNRIGFTV